MGIQGTAVAKGVSEMVSRTDWPIHGGVPFGGTDAKSDPTVRSTPLSAALCCDTRLVKEYDDALKDEFWRPTICPARRTLFSRWR